ncbi:hypothetical protein GOP47_0001819 [Adiantum capillus-veneris]|uniref:Uncharacterized protein n=1 Tax=Adiantum capillus-veneris TaxID=13818 RepID=A0A9D4ZQE3_ADICA|nr:hypothetical protein GOP47_0001819 [Adiantum capillus-veneris]
MEQLQFKDIHVLLSNHPQLSDLSFEHCRFARDRELMLEWEDVCGPLCVAVLRQFLWEYYSKEQGRMEEEEEEGLKEAMLSCLLKSLPVD